MFHGEEYGAAPLSADSDPLNEPERNEQDRSPDANLVEGRRQADERCRDAHDQQRPHEHLLPSQPIAEVSKDRSAQWPRNESDGKRAVRAERAGERIEGREEEPVEDQRRGGAVEEEVVPLDRRA